MTYPRGAIRHTSKYALALLKRGKRRTLFHVSNERKQIYFFRRVTRVPIYKEYIIDSVLTVPKEETQLDGDATWHIGLNKDVEFLFVNYWHAHAYLMKLRQSNEE